eukprot:654091_1
MAVREALQNIDLNTYTDIIQSTRVQSQTHLSHILFTEDDLKQYDLAGSSTGSFCEVCDRKFDSARGYLGHIATLHQMIESIVLHQMKHVLDAQARSNRDTAPIDRLLMCFFCGTASDNGCNVKCIKKPGKSANYEITADCLDGVIGGRFYVSLCNVTKSSPWANHPVLCNVTKCSETHWRWNIKNHYRVKHPNMKIPVTLEVSKFEEKCVEFIKGKYFRKKQMEMLLESYSEQTKALFPPKKKQQKKKKQKKKSDKRTMSSEDETASSDDNEDETTNNNNNESIAIDSDNNGMETTNNNNNEANVVLNAIDKDNKKKENQESDVS